MEEFDVFLSYSSVDKEWVMQLKSMLAGENIRVWFDKDEIRPGDLFSVELEKALDNSKTVVIVISPESINSGWCQEEYARALSLHEERGCQVVPVIYRKAQVPGFLANRHHVDFTAPSNLQNALKDLIWGITGKNPRHERRGFQYGDKVRIVSQRPNVVDRFPLTHTWDRCNDKYLGKQAKITEIDFNSRTVHLDIDNSSEQYPFEWISIEQ